MELKSTCTTTGGVYLAREDGYSLALLSVLFTHVLSFQYLIFTATGKTGFPRVNKSISHQYRLCEHNKRTSAAFLTADILHRIHRRPCLAGPCTQSLLNLLMHYTNPQSTWPHSVILSQCHTVCYTLPTYRYQCTACYLWFYCILKLIQKTLDHPVKVLFNNTHTGLGRMTVCIKLNQSSITKIPHFKSPNPQLKSCNTLVNC